MFQFCSGLSEANLRPVSDTAAAAAHKRREQIAAQPKAINFHRFNADSLLRRV
jgi:hypothetical protein